MIEVYVWIPCLDCDEYWCVVHEKHAFECECPSVEVWEENGFWPYGLTGISEMKPDERLRFQRFLEDNKDG